MLTENETLFGLSDRDIETISGILKKYPEVTEVYIFGSRAIGNYKTGSDIDLALMNKGISPQTILYIKTDLDDSSLPFTVDLINYSELTHPELADHIKRVGQVLYKSSK